MKRFSVSGILDVAGMAAGLCLGFVAVHALCLSSFFGVSLFSLAAAGGGFGDYALALCRNIAG